MIITITIEDTNEGQCRIKCEFDPPIADDTGSTAASEAAMIAIEAIKRRSEHEPWVEEDHDN
jgi:hypothetical protein